MATLSVRRPAPQPQVAEAPLEARCADGLASIPASDWDGLIGPASGPLKHGYLRAWEKVELSGLCSRPVVASSVGSTKPSAACPGYLYDLDLPTARDPQAGNLVRLVRRLWPKFLFARTYELGSPTPLTNPFLVADARQRPEAVCALISAGLEEAARARASFTLVQNFTSRGTPAGQELARLGFAGVPIPATAVVDLPYRSFEEYLQAMRAQYRRRAQQTLKRSDALTAEHLGEFESHAEELTRLYRCVYDRASEVKREAFTPQYFREVSRLAESSVLLMRRRDGSIASFALLLDDDPWLSFLHCGFEVESGRKERAYFRLLYEIVRLGIEHGYEQIDLGMTTLEPKLDVGAVPVPLFAWVKHRNPVLQRVILALARGPLRPPDLEPRRVFKEPPPEAAELVARRGLAAA